VIALTIRAIDDAAGLVLPQEALNRLDLKVGDTVVLAEDAGGYRLLARDPAFDDQMAQAERIMEEDKEILQRLAR
jgi:putative addiction module antidote